MQTLIISARPEQILCKKLAKQLLWPPILSLASARGPMPRAEAARATPGAGPRSMTHTTSRRGQILVRPRVAGSGDGGVSRPAFKCNTLRGQTGGRSGSLANIDTIKASTRRWRIQREESASGGGSGPLARRRNKSIMLNV